MTYANSETDSYRRIIRATVLMGGATVIAIMIGVVRSKIFALWLGPLGIGLIGLITNIMTAAASIGGMGLGVSGVRQISAHDGNRGMTRAALWLAVWPLAIVSAVIIWLARDEIARWVTGGEDQSLAIGLAGVGAALSIIAVAQIAVMQGLGRVGDVARVRVLGAALSLVIGIPAVLYAGQLGIVLAVIALPFGNVVAALPFRPPAERGSGPITRSQIVCEWRHMLALGVTMMLATSLLSATLVLIRTILIRSDGLEAAGLYQAAFAISALNGSLVLSAMATDYLPRLSSIQSDKRASAVLVNQQLHAALLLASPVLLVMAALAPLVLRVLYSNDFSPAAGMLRWQLTGELLKLPGWALGFLLIARAKKARFLLVESSFAVAYCGLAVLLLPVAGLAGVGMAYAGGYMVYSLLLFGICLREETLTLSRENLLHLTLVGAALSGVSLLSHRLPSVATATGLLAAAAATWHMLRHLNEIRRPLPTGSANGLGPRLRRSR